MIGLFPVSIRHWLDGSHWCLPVQPRYVYVFWTQRAKKLRFSRLRAAGEGRDGNKNETIWLLLRIVPRREQNHVKYRSRVCDHACALSFLPLYLPLFSSLLTLLLIDPLSFLALLCIFPNIVHIKVLVEIFQKIFLLLFYSSPFLSFYFSFRFCIFIFCSVSSRGTKLRIKMNWRIWDTWNPRITKTGLCERA